MPEKNSFDTALSTPKHWIAVAAILASGMIGGALILRTSASPLSTGHSEAASHGDDEHHGQGSDKDHQDPESHNDTEHHEEAAPKAESKNLSESGREDHGHGEKDEGVIKLSDSQSKAIGVQLAQAESAVIRKEIVLPGEIRLDEDRTAHVVPRVSGVVASVHAQLGQMVTKGQLLAVIQSAAVSDQRSELQTAQKRLALARITHEREKQLWEEKISAEQDYLQARQALQEAEIAVSNASQKLASIGVGVGSANQGGSSRYELRAPLSGIVVAKHLTVGESVTESAASFTLSDMGSVWAEMSVSAPQLPYVRVGAPASVRTTAFESNANGRVAYVGALIGEQSRTAPARVALSNPQGVWRPGLFVDVTVVAEEIKVAVAVETLAVQRTDGKESSASSGDKHAASSGQARGSIFVPTEGGYKALTVQLGRSDGRYTEIVGGLPAGQAYVKDGSFMLKAELGKASAEHTH